MGNKLRFDHEEDDKGDKTDSNERRTTDSDVELDRKCIVQKLMIAG